jgi:putative membrane protein
MLLLDEELRSFLDITGACERIKHTPIPYSYSLFLKKIIFIYIISMPIAFSVEFGYWSIPIVIFTFYAFASLELISEEIEDPFGDDANDLPTQELSEKIKSNLDEITKG